MAGCTLACRRRSVWRSVCGTACHHRCVWESRRDAADDADEVVLPRLDRFFCYVAAMIVRQPQLLSHSCGSDFRFVGFGYFIVQNLILGHDALLFHAFQYSVAGRY